MSRWSKCPGSVRLSKGMPNKSSVFAEEGSDAHALAAECLRYAEDPVEYVGYDLEADGRKFTVTQEMAESVAVYTWAVWELEYHEWQCKIEHRFDLSKVHPGCFGTADCVIWQPDTATLHVFDLKYGAGIPVEVKGNPQLQYYGLGALLSCGYPAKTVKLTIVQPRCHHPDGPVRSWEIDAIDLLDFRADLKAYAVATQDPAAPIVPGDHCRFCPAKPMCPALRNKAQAVAKLEFSPVLSYDPEQLRLTLDSVPVMEAWIKGVREFAYSEAEAGRTPPGYKLVAKRATRKWRSEGEVIEILQTAYPDDGIFEPRELKSPAQLEKTIGKANLAKLLERNEAGHLITSESSGHALAPESDPRPPVKLAARDEFTSVEHVKG